MKTAQDHDIAALVQLPLEVNWTNTSSTEPTTNTAAAQK